MEFSKVNKDFKMVGLKGTGSFASFSHEVPLLAQELLNRENEIQHHAGIEIALFEPKRGSDHEIGSYYVGLMVDEKVNEVPDGMTYLETNQHYVTTKGTISNVGTLHMNLVKWAEEQGYERDLNSYIVETYHPVKDHEEEVHIYLPVSV
ncbi:GyrI-like domain-containing protein [Bacillus sp. RD4P76]|uniref:GyrI-like domain-containing protein n=2 Tax=Bacillus suaedaesalsae TaxID=2810349 RepID=A0ABS2DHA5_9BACI|nr:GyrI-like domain-containing protein [Bacillus suaedaesalsae]